MRLYCFVFDCNELELRCFVVVNGCYTFSCRCLLDTYTQIRCSRRRLCRKYHFTIKFDFVINLCFEKERIEKCLVLANFVNIWRSLWIYLFGSAWCSNAFVRKSQYEHFSADGKLVEWPWTTCSSGYSGYTWRVVFYDTLWLVNWFGNHRWLVIGKK